MIFMGDENSVKADGELLRRDRKAAKLSQDALATLAQVSESTVRRVERGHDDYFITKTRLGSLARELGFPLERYIVDPFEEPQRKGGINHETYQVIDIFEHATKEFKECSARIVLTRSSLSNAGGHMDIDLDCASELKVRRYSFTNSFSHLLFAPGKLICPKISSEFSIMSNNFECTLRMKAQRVESLDDVAELDMGYSERQFTYVETVFDFESGYTGPRYLKRQNYFQKGVGLVLCKVTYEDNDQDIMKLVDRGISEGKGELLPAKAIGNFWTYEIRHDRSPNVTNFCE